MQWLIDGHNLIGQMPNLGLDDPQDEEKLLEYLRSYRARTGHSLTVIFDPGQSYHPAKIKKRGGITVQFAPHGQTADQLIIRQIRRLKNPQEVIVVTSDQAVQQAARQARVRVVTAPEFAQQLLKPSAEVGEDKGSEADIKLSPAEVDEWLKLFKRPKS